MCHMTNCQLHLLQRLMFFRKCPSHAQLFHLKGLPHLSKLHNSPLSMGMVCLEPPPGFSLLVKGHPNQFHKPNMQQD